VLARRFVRPLWAAVPAVLIFVGIDLAPSYWFPHPGWLSAAGTLMTVLAIAHVPAVEAHQRARWLFVVGVLTALVFALKQNAGVFLGLSVAVFLLLQGLELSPRPVSPALRAAQLVVLGGLLAALMWLMRAHLDAFLVGYFVAPIAAIGLLLMRAPVGRSGETLRSRLALIAPVSVGFVLSTAPWLLAVVLSLDGHLERLSSFVGAVQVGMFSPIVLPGKIVAAVLGLALLGVAGVRLARVNPWLPAIVGAGLLLVLRLVHFVAPDQYTARTLFEAPWLAGSGLTELLPSAAFWAGLWLARRWGHQERRAWLLRFCLAAGALTFLTQYPILDEVHLAWSAGLLFVVGVVVLDGLHTWLATRWRLTRSAGAPLAAALLLVPIVGASAPLMDWRAPEYFTRDKATGLPQLKPLVRLETVRYAEPVWVSPDVRDDLTSLLETLQRTTAPDEPIFVYPVSPLIYVLAERPNPTRYEHLYPGTISPAGLREVVEALEQAQVRTVVTSKYSLLLNRSSAENWIVEDYLATNYQESWRSATYRILQRV
jgi:hypothetical protein